MCPVVSSHKRNRSRFPYGERGLKLTCEQPREVIAKSLPARGAWIEIHKYRGAACSGSSLPAWGAWVETAL